MPEHDTPEPDPSDSASSDAPASEEQRSQLRDAGEEIPEDLTKAQAAQLIDQLQHRTGAE